MTTSENLDLQPASRWDESDVIALDDRASFDPDRHDYLISAVKTGHCLVARDGGELVGFAIWNREFFGNPFIWLIYVHPNDRRRGVATALIRKIEQWCSTEKLFTSTNESNDAMHRLLERLGFVRSGFVNNLDPGDPEIIYVTGLAPAAGLGHDGMIGDNRDR